MNEVPSMRMDSRMSRALSPFARLSDPHVCEAKQESRGQNPHLTGLVIPANQLVVVAMKKHTRKDNMLMIKQQWQGVWFAGEMGVDMKLWQDGRQSALTKEGIGGEQDLRLEQQ